jgi:hypothetical protein
MANILYLPVHSILEYDQMKLLTSLGHNVFSIGSYINPRLPIDPKRPPIEAKYFSTLHEFACQCTKDDLHQGLLNWADVILIDHNHNWVIRNWAKLRFKKVIWRTIGQSMPDIEGLMTLPKMEGCKIVRYSPAERNIPSYAGEDAVIRFYKNSDEFSCWHGAIPAVMTVGQSMKSRIDHEHKTDFCNYEKFMEVTQNYPRIIFGPGNEDSEANGGVLGYEELKDAYRKHRCFFYTGTYPASYTLGFIEAMMTGIPIIAIGPKTANLNLWPMNTYEVDSIIQNEVNGFYSDDFVCLRSYIDQMITHPEEAKRIGEAGRKTAVSLFSEEVIRYQWKQFIEDL